MSDFVFYIKLEKYLSQWLIHSLGHPVRFPAQSNENSVIRRFLQKRPADKQPELMFEGATAIVIPDSKAKEPTVFNYLGTRAKEAVIEAIEDLFRRNMWVELGDLSDASVGLNKMIAAWCEMHGIDDDYVETVRQKYYRIRNSYNKKGIFLNSLTRKREDKQAIFEQPRTDMNNVLKYINKIEMIEAKHLVNSTIVNNNSILFEVYCPFDLLDTIGLSTVETSDKIENKVRIHTSKLTVLLSDLIEVGNKKLCFRVTTVSGEQYIIGTDKRPFPVITFNQNFPNSASAKCGCTMSVTYSNTIPMLLQLD